MDIYVGTFCFKCFAFSWIPRNNKLFNQDLLGKPRFIPHRRIVLHPSSPHNNFVRIVKVQSTSRSIFRGKARDLESSVGKFPNCFVAVYSFRQFFLAIRIFFNHCHELVY